MYEQKKSVFEQKEASRSNSTWSTLKVNDLLKQIDEGHNPQITPFWEGSFEWRAPNIVFEYTTEEFEILKRCANDVVFFANNYACAMTDAGIDQIQLRPYQEDVMRDFNDFPFNIFLSPRQSGKCVDYGTIITVKNADTHEILHIPIGRFYFRLSKDKTVYDYMIYFLNEAKIKVILFKKMKFFKSFFCLFN